MFKFYEKFLNRTLLSSLKGSEVGQIDGIVLFDARNRGDRFRPIIENALQLIRQHDPRRYARVVRYISRIVNIVLPRGTGSRYDFGLRAVYVEFGEWKFGEWTTDLPLWAHDDELIAYYACLLVQESTIGVVKSRGMERTSANRIRIKRLCLAEVNRFAARLTAADPVSYPSERLHAFLDENDYYKPKNRGPLKRVSSSLWRTFRDKKMK
jgi:hypothetical protein